MADRARPRPARPAPAAPPLLAGPLAPGRRLGRADPGDPAPLRRRDRPDRRPSGSATTSTARCAAPSQILASELEDRLLAFGEPDIARRPAARRLRPARRRLGPRLRRRRQPVDESAGAVELGPPSAGIHDYGEMRVATARRSAKTGASPATSSTGAASTTSTSTIDRLWLLIAAGILGGTLLAILAGVAIAGRAMRPIASLTATAREIADHPRPLRSGCPSRRPTTRSASWPGPWSRCCARSTPPGPSARRRCRSSASSSPTPRTSCARR